MATYTRRFVVHTCRRLHGLTVVKTFWLSLLEFANGLRPIACPPEEDLAALDVQKLKGIALHTLQRDENLALSEPKYEQRSLKKFRTGIEVNAAFHVPGTRLLVLCDASDGKASCWDTLSKKKVCVSAYVGRKIFDWSFAKQYRNKILKAFFVADSANATLPTALIVLCLNYPSGEKPKPFFDILFKHEFHAPVNPSDIVHCDLNLEFVVVTSRQGKETVDITIFDYTRKTRRVIHTDIPAADDYYRLEPCFQGKQLHLFVHHPHWTYFHTCSKADIAEEAYISLLQHSENQKYSWPKTSSEISPCEYEHFLSCSCGPRTLTTVHYVASTQNSNIQGIEFFYWDPSRSGKTTPITSFLVKGYLQDNGDDILIDNTSSSSVLFFHEPLEVHQTALKLLTFDEGSSTPTLHSPKIPKEWIFTQRENLYNILFDELLGTIYFVTRRGRLLCVPYA
ncbi:hypothetical protein WG66_012279 [Moniliophthora roreri]|uniref:Uncharacterized protein n=1 Tax=Moniliophthora roreri TaxID=221103 RepID=A0A0W0EZ77_MONRR|nr:hypothetical protein WG66_012279 [Moniliophthora roreri]